MFKTYLKSILIPVILGGLVGLITRGNFATLVKPSLTPPGFIFPIIWTILYILMGLGYGYLKVHNLNTLDIKKAYYTQLIVNLIWPIIFFLFHLRLLAFIWIIILDYLVLSMIIKFIKKEKWVGLIQIPYLVWVLFATYLNLFFYLLNR